jgi:hypothetical protein
MNIDNPKAFAPLLNDRLRAAGTLRLLPCMVDLSGAMSMGGVRIHPQEGEHLLVRIEKRFLPTPPVHDAQITLESNGTGLAKEVHSEGDFWAITVTKHARRGL